MRRPEMDETDETGMSLPVENPLVAETNQPWAV